MSQTHGKLEELITAGNTLSNKHVSVSAHVKRLETWAKSTKHRFGALKSAVTVARKDAALCHKKLVDISSQEQQNETKRNSQSRDWDIVLQGISPSDDDFSRHGVMPSMFKPERKGLTALSFSISTDAAATGDAFWAGASLRKRMSMLLLQLRYSDVKVGQILDIWSAWEASDLEYTLMLIDCLKLLNGRTNLALSIQYLAICLAIRLNQAVNQNNSAASPALLQAVQNTNPDQSFSDWL